jgi:hypothetical protein
MNTPLDPLAVAYLDRLRNAARALDARERDDLVCEVEAHLMEAIPPGATEAEVRTVLDRLGEPEEIVAVERPPVKARGAVEWLAIILLPVGGLMIPFVGWVIAVVLLWSSRAWSSRDKVIGTFLLPGGLLPAFMLLFLGTSTSSGSCPPRPAVAAVRGAADACTTGPSTARIVVAGAILVAAVVIPIWSAIHLARSADRPTAA